MKFWQAITWAETEQLPAIAQFAEELGYEGLMGGDHALWPGSMAPSYPYSDTGYPPQTEDSEYPDQWVSIAAMAAVTQRIRFTTGVYVLPLRNPIEVARATGTLAILSQDRFVLGVGAGWMKEEFDIYGVDFKTRGKRMNECIEAMQLLWEDRLVEYHGDFVDFPPIRLAPAPQSQVPIFVGGANQLALKRAARYADGWIGAGNTPEEVPAILQRLNSLRAEYGRADLPFETLVGLYAEQTVDVLRPLEEVGMTATLNLPFEYALGRGSSLDDKKRFMENYAEAVIRPMQEDAS